MRKQVLAWLVLAMLMVAAMPPVTHAAAPPAPTLVDRNPDGTVGDWYLGATPPDADPQKPVLVFVHGMNGVAQGWWGPTTYHGDNDMYAYAYRNGYRTAFVQLAGDRSMWYNGDLLSEMLDDIRAHFGVAQVTVVAHSKGGVDANAASAHFGAAPKVERVVTLGSPHWGTPLADLAYSWWAWWLAAIFGYQSEAVYVMQTGYMDWFRSVTDGRDPQVPYYTLSGYKCGPLFSAYWWGCVYISGEDDGVVPVWSARKPGGTHLKEGYWDHDEIKMGSRTWSWFAPQLSTASGQPLLAWPAVAAASGARFGAGAAAAQPSAPGNLILRGGEVTGTAAAPEIPLEPGIKQVTLAVYASSRDLAAVLVGPDGSRHAVQMQGQVPAGEVFGGAWLGTVEIRDPAPGAWQLAVTAGKRAGYLAVLALESQLQATLDAGRGVAAPGARRQIAVQVHGPVAPAGTRVEATVAFSGQQPHARPAFTHAGGVWRGSVNLPKRAGIHNLTVTVRGMTTAGFPFERTLVSSLAAVPPAQRGPWTGRN